MSEREAGSDRTGSEAIPFDDHRGPTTRPDGIRANAQMTEAERRARVLAALDKVMEDHHEVLAALAK